MLILIVAAVVKMHMGWKGKKAFTDGSRKLALFTMIAFPILMLFASSEAWHRSLDPS